MKCHGGNIAAGSKPPTIAAVCLHHRHTCCIIALESSWLWLLHMHVQLWAQGCLPMGSCSSRRPLGSIADGAHGVTTGAHCSTFTAVQLNFGCHTLTVKRLLGSPACMQTCNACGYMESTDSLPGRVDLLWGRRGGALHRMCDSQDINSKKFTHQPSQPWAGAPTPTSLTTGHALCQVAVSRFTASSHSTHPLANIHGIDLLQCIDCIGLGPRAHCTHTWPWRKMAPPTAQFQQQCRPACNPQQPLVSLKEAPACGN